MPSFAAFGNDLYSGRRSIDFVGRRRLWYLVALAAMVLSIGSLAVRGINEGIEFRGGSEFRVTGTATTSELEGQNAVTSVVPKAVVHVSSVGANGVRIQTDRLAESDTPKVVTAIAKAYKVPEAQVSSNFVGPTWGRDVSQKAYTGLGVFLVLVGLVIALYFRTWKMAVAAIIALVHDLALTIGIYALVGFEVTPATVIGLLTILGYSLYDTVVVFDKVRENTDHITATTKRTYAEAANLAVNQTLVRSINTSVVALLPVASILFIGALLLGAGTLKDISLSLFVGIAAGTYSSIFIATPLLVHLRQNEPAMRAQAERVRKRRIADAEAASRAAAEPEQPTPVAAGGVTGEPVEAGAAAATRPGSGQRVQPRRNAPGKGRPGGRKS